MAKTPAKTPGSGPARKVAVAAPPPGTVPGPEARRLAEPVWLVRIVLVLFLVGFASFLAREVYNFLHTL